MLPWYNSCNVPGAFALLSTPGGEPVITCHPLPPFPHQVVHIAVWLRSLPRDALEDGQTLNNVRLEQRTGVGTVWGGEVEEKLRG